MLRTILACASLALLNACASHSVASGRVPEEGLTVGEIYHASIGEALKSERMPRFHVPATALSSSGYTRTADNENHALFKPLENPAVPIFIYPHVVAIGDEQLLKPGFTTEFFLYKQNQFALASERY
jgi:conjugative transfer region lipoprotein (TIGR03751 family)